VFSPHARRRRRALGRRGCPGRCMASMQLQPDEHRPCCGEQPQFQPQPPGRLLSTEPGEHACECDAETDPGVHQRTQGRCVPTRQFRQAPAADAHQRPGAEDARAGTQHGTDKRRGPSSDAGDGQRGERHPEEGQLQSAQRIGGEPGRGERAQQVAGVIRRRPFRARGGAQRAVAQHQRQQRREREAADAHGHRERDGAADDHEPGFSVCAVDLGHGRRVVRGARAAYRRRPGLVRSAAGWRRHAEQARGVAPGSGFPSPCPRRI